MSDTNSIKYMLALPSADSISNVAKLATDAIDENIVILHRVLADAPKLFLSVQAGEMNDEIDAKMADIIKDASASMKQMKENRKVVTQVFDNIRKGFTTLEKQLDVNAEGSDICKMQALRNGYAKKKLADQQRKEAARRLAAAKDAAVPKYEANVKLALAKMAADYKQEAVTRLSNIFTYLTAKNSAEIEEELKVDAKKCAFVHLKREHVAAELRNMGIAYPAFPDIEIRVIDTMLKAEAPRIIAEVKETQAETAKDLLSRIPEKVKELKDIEKRRREAERKSAEEAERMRIEQEKRLAEMARIDEEKRKEREAAIQAQREEQERATAIEAADAQAKALFAQAEYIADPVKAKKTESINVLSPEGFADVMQTWWVYEGSKLDMETLNRRLGFMVRFCERLANKEGTHIKSDNVEYVENVKAE